MDSNPSPDPLRDMAPPRPGSRRSRRRMNGGGGGPPVPPTPLLVVLLLVAAGFAWWWFGWRGPSGSDLVGPSGFTDTGALPDTALGDTRGLADPVEPLDLPELDESDALIRRLAGALTAHPRWAGWLVTDRLVERFVASVVTLAAGNSPREQLPFLEPEGDFRVRTSGDGLVIDPASFRRYDAFTEALVGIDRNGAVRLYRQLRPLFLDAYARLGFPPEQFDAHVARAMDNLIDAPVFEGPFRVRQGVEVYEYEDAALEVLTPAEKHILRLGPENALRVQAKLRQLRGALVVAGALPIES
jgi:hypothetical protein